MENYNITKQSYEKNSDIFIEQWKDTNNINNGKIETFIDLLPQKAKILDVGAGFGKDVTYFCGRGFDCVGIDFCDEFIKKSKMLYSNVKIYTMNFLEIDFPENTFDALWSRGALFHISKRDFITVLQKLSAILKPDGVFYIQLIAGNHDDLMDRIGSVEGCAHYSYYSVDELKTIMANCGFVYIKEFPKEGWINHYYRLIK
jgi:SAM-dependent methyltransferase